MADRLERFINLIAKSGDKLLVYDRHQPDDSFVLVSLPEFERLTIEANGVKGLTEDELIDKINRDIASWKGEQFGGHSEQEFAAAPSEFPETAQPVSRKPRSHGWSIPQSRRREDSQKNI